jgi:hypothetical protein
MLQKGARTCIQNVLIKQGKARSGTVIIIKNLDHPLVKIVREQVLLYKGVFDPNQEPEDGGSIVN